MEENMMTERNESATERLDGMLADGKVSQSEYDTLAAALEKSPLLDLILP
jgi:hypothetical protein